MQRWVLVSGIALSGLLLWVLTRSNSSKPDDAYGTPRRAQAPTFPVRGGSWQDADSGSTSADFGSSSGNPERASRDQRRQLLRPRAEVLSPEGRFDVVEDKPAAAERELATRPKVFPPVGVLPGDLGVAPQGLVSEAALALSFDDPKAGAGSVQPLAEKDVKYDEYGAVFGPNALFVAPPPENVGSNSGSVAFWLQPAWAGDSGSNNAYFVWRTPHSFENRVSIFKNGPFLRLLLADSLGQEANVAHVVSHWRADEWHHVAGTWGDYGATFYIDGRAVGYAEYANDILIAPGAPWYIGSDYPGGAEGANSRIRGFHVFPRALQPEEVLTLMEQTRPPGA